MYQTRITSSLAAIQRSGQWADNCIVHTVYLHLPFLFQELQHKYYLSLLA